MFPTLLHNWALPVLVLSFASCAQAQMVWKELVPERTNHAVAYDSARGHMIMHGGSREDGLLAADLLWTWNGTRWQRLRATGPGSRKHHAICFDTNRQKLVLFGGQDANGQMLGDTWEWNGAVWNQVATSGPSPRINHAMVYDALRGHVLLFGGGDSIGGNAQTWTWDGIQWNQLTVAGPTARASHCMAYDSARGRTVLFGPSAETWEWTGFGWQPMLFANHPQPRSDASLVYDTARNRTVLFGGSPGGTNATETWEWDGVNWSLTSSSGPSQRTGHAACFDIARQRTVVFGGFGASGTVSEFDGQIWSTTAETPPSVQSRGRLVYDSQRQVSILFPDGSPANYWEWDGLRWIKRQGAPVTPTASGPMAYDRGRQRVVFLPQGYQIVSEWTNGIWTTIVPTASIPGLENTKIVFDLARNRTVAFGGQFNINGGYTLDHMSWNGASWTVRQPVNPWPPGRILHSLTYDSLRQRILLVGGSSPNSSTPSSDAWEWDGNAWIRVADIPAARRGHAAAFDPTRGKTVVLGGNSTSPAILGDAWEWDGASWSHAITDQSTPMQMHEAVFDAARGKIITFSSFPRSGTWELAFDGESTSFGTGCGNRPLTLAPPAPPILGTPHETRVVNFPTPLVFMSIGLNNSFSGPFPLPLPLDGYGLPGCSIYHDFAYTATDPCTMPNSATVLHTLQLPNLPPILGQHAYLQAWAFAPGDNPAGLLTSNAHDLVLGNR